MQVKRYIHNQHVQTQVKSSLVWEENGAESFNEIRGISVNELM